MSQGRMLNSMPGEVVIRVQHGQPQFLVSPIGLQSPAPSHSWRRLIMIGLVMVGLQVAAPVTHAFTAGELVHEMNQTRQANGLGILYTNDQLTAAAAMKADNMFTEQYFGHTSPTGDTPWSWYQAAGYAYTEAGENLAMDFPFARNVVEAWMESSGHRENMLDRAFDDIGVAVKQGTINGKNTIVIVAEFGSQTAVVTPAPVPKSAAHPVATVPTPTPAQVGPAPEVPLTPAQKLIPSLAGPVQRPEPNLTYTLSEPIPFLGPSLVEPTVLGASIGPTRNPENPDLAMLSLISLGLSFSTVVGWAFAQGSWLQPTISTG